MKNFLVTLLVLNSTILIASETYNLAVGETLQLKNGSTVRCTGDQPAQSCSILPKVQTILGQTFTDAGCFATCSGSYIPRCIPSYFDGTYYIYSRCGCIQ